jgi:polyphosphate kinase 2
MSTDKKASGVSSSPIDVDSIALIDSDQAKSASNSITVPGNNKNGHGTAAPEPEAKKKKTQIEKSESKLSEDDLRRVNTNKGLLTLLRTKDIKIKDVTADLEYEEELERLQVELVKLQRWVQDKGKRVAIILGSRRSGKRAAQLGRFTEHLNPRSMRVVALPKPTQQERCQWYFQRYSVQLPNAGEIVIFDRSWYNRAVVEPVNGFCTKVEYQRFIQQVPEFEHMLYEDGITIIKFWFSISKEEQRKRFESRQSNPLKQWKLSPIDQQSQDLWEHYTSHKEEMFSRTHMSFSPWIVVKANDKRMARLESIRYVLNLLDYTGKGDAKVRLYPDPNIVNRFHRQIANID